MERFGFVGQPNAGKSSLFNALTGSQVLAAPYPFATVDSNVGVAAVKDDRLIRLAEMSKSKSVVSASVGFTDIGGLVEGASEGEGLGNQFLGAIREVDAIVYVIRAFESKDLPEIENPLEQLKILEVELSLADLESAEKQFEKRMRQAKADNTLQAQAEPFKRAVEFLTKGIPIYRSEMSDEEKEILRFGSFLTNKPVMVVLNVDESDFEKAEQVAELEAGLGAGQVIPVCVKLEAEALELEQSERQVLLKDFGVKEPALAKFVRVVYELLGLNTFFTTGPKETRAWTFSKGSYAPECAGLIHSDMERGFIRADCISTEELLGLGSIQAAKEIGKIQGVGKDYQVKDGDVLEIRFNV